MLVTLSLCRFFFIIAYYFFYLLFFFSIFEDRRYVRALLNNAKSSFCALILFYFRFRFRWVVFMFVMKYCLYFLCEQNSYFGERRGERFSGCFRVNFFFFLLISNNNQQENKDKKIRGITSFLSSNFFFFIENFYISFLQTVIKTFRIPLLY